MPKRSDGVRAVRNNNPGNIERGAKWQGLMPAAEMTPDQSAESRFAVFKSPKWGFRALAITLITYQDKRRAADGSIIDTVEEAISRWAPPSENDTESYVRQVCRLTGFDRRDRLDFHSRADLAPLAKAIATHECGGWFFDDKDLDAGLRLAGVEEPPDSIVKSRTVQVASVGTAATGIGLIGEAAAQLAPATSLAREVGEYAPTAAAVIVIVVLLAVIWYRYDDWKRAKS
jgi:hypothetical protein